MLFYFRYAGSSANDEKKNIIQLFFWIYDKHPNTHPYHSWIKQSKNLLYAVFASEKYLYLHLSNQKKIYVGDRPVVIAYYIYIENTYTNKNIFVKLIFIIIIRHHHHQRDLKTESACVNSQRIVRFYGKV